MAASIKLKKPMELIINNYQFQVPADFIDVKYYSYNLLKNEIGIEKTLNDGSTNINGHETVVAKFELAKELPLKGLENPSSSFWERFSLKVGFPKVGNEYPMVDGLMLITREPNLGVLSSEFKVPWGSEHQIRRRSASRVAM